MRLPTGAIAVFLLALGGASRAPASENDASFLRGVVVSCPRSGQIWGTEAMTEALLDIRSLGANAIAIHPYAWVATDGTIRSHPAAETGYLDEAVRRLRAAGMTIFWKPHLGYWGSFEWRGAIEFGSDEAAWRRFFSGYETFIVDQARFAERHGIELFAVGVEYERTTHREKEWRGIIAAVRRAYSGRITYAANWDGLSKVPFWDALDVLGVHAYFPLSDEPAPTRTALLSGWEPHLAELAGLSALHGKPIVLAEIGYNRAADSASRPWSHGTQDTAEHRALRGLLMEVALDRLEKEPYLAGMFWWKWMPGARSGRDFSLKEVEAREALRAHWAAPLPPRVTAN